MKLSLCYVRSVLPWQIDEHMIEEGFKLLGLEVEEKVSRNNVVGSVFGKIVQIDEAGEKIRIAKVEISSGQTVLIVTNSEKAVPGAIVPIAPIGAKIAGVLVEARTVRGNKSEGFFLTAAEYGVDLETLPQSEREGAWVMPSDTPLFTDPAESMWLSDTFFTLKITPNHPEWLSLRGLIREIAAASWQKTGKIPQIPSLDAMALPTDCDTLSRFKLDIEDGGDCRRYVGVLAEATPKLSSFEMRKRLLAAGLRPINSVVDASNLAMYEDGQPTHAFDADTLKSGIVRVARTKAPMKFKTLDDADRDIPIGTLMIWDGDKPIAIAGIMGGTETEVTDNTKRIFLESAHFEPLQTAKSSMLLGLRSEASTRFEKGADWEQAEKTAWKVLELCGAKACKPAEFFEDKARRTVELRPERMKGILGFDLPIQSIIEGFATLGIEAKIDGVIKAIIPGFRDNDLRKEIDLIEEAIRVFGYDKIPTTFPVVEVAVVLETPIFMLERRARGLMLGQGFSECYSKTWSCEEELNSLKLSSFKDRAPKIINPMTTDGTMMKPLLEIGLLGIASYNIHQRNTDLALFEIGTQFGPEQRRLSILLSGLPIQQWDEKTVKKEPQEKSASSDGYDFFDLKGQVETLFNQLLLPERTFKESSMPHLHPHRQAEIIIEGVHVGYMGELHPDVMAKLDLQTTCIIGNIDLEAILRFVSQTLHSKSVPKFPEVLRDIAVLAPLDVPEREIEHTIKEVCKGELKEVRLFDQFIGHFADAKKRSLAFSLKFSDEDGTLLGTQIDEIVKQIDQALRELGAHLRMA